MDTTTAAAKALKLVVTGAGGQLGRAVMALVGSPTAPLRDFFPFVEVVGLTRAELDLTDAAAVAAHPVLGAVDADTVVLHAAAYTAVDAAEAEEEAAAAWAANEQACAAVGEAAARGGALVVGVSTDYVFGLSPRLDGAGNPRPWRVDDECAPQGVYARSKFAGEQALRASGARCCIARTAWVFSGDAVPGARDFVSVMAARARQAAPAQVVCDQVGSPTFVVDLAVALLSLAAAGCEGTVHVAGSGQASWFEVARAVYAECGADENLVSPIRSDQWPAAAPRPPFSVLDGASLVAAGVAALPQWRDGVRRAVAGQVVPDANVIADLSRRVRLH